MNIYNGAVWTGFQLLGGLSISEPACVGTAFIGNFATHCAIIGVNSALHVNTFDGTQWSGFKRLGGSYIYNPTCTQDWTFAGVFCAAVTMGAKLEGWKNVSGSTGAWVKMPQAVGAQVTADPNCAGIGREQILCAVRSGTRLKVNRADDASTWPLITDLGGIPHGGAGLYAEFASASGHANRDVCGARHEQRRANDLIRWQHVYWISGGLPESPSWVNPAAHS